MPAVEYAYDKLQVGVTPTGEPIFVTLNLFGGGLFEPSRLASYPPPDFTGEVSLTCRKRMQNTPSAGIQLCLEPAVFVIAAPGDPVWRGMCTEHLGNRGDGYQVRRLEKSGDFTFANCAHEDTTECGFACADISGMNALIFSGRAVKFAEIAQQYSTIAQQTTMNNSKQIARMGWVSILCVVAIALALTALIIEAVS